MTLENAIRNMMKDKLISYIFLSSWACLLLGSSAKSAQNRETKKEEKRGQHLYNQNGLLAHFKMV
jgi:hypothetical protein